VMQILRDIADKNQAVLRFPAPVVALDNLGDNALEFSLRVLLADISKTVETRSDLHLAIIRAFRANNIEIPNAQYDVNLRTLDGAKPVLALAAAE
jgi:potassium-dependent mechanosensitive channel